ncbi:uncharacterized protein LOC135331045 isoform X2 [Halichondria panicea]|uniref:uncharacterized protein LOC135331045 isoform X2 n=1 Tax=Halichondria panicea TaxID=6063 RepID=UPI00312B6B3D
MSNVQKINDELVVHLNEEVGSGTFGMVFKGMYKNKVCAIKMLHHVATPLKINFPVGQGQENAIRAFGYESMVLESFQHPNVLQHLATTKYLSGNTMLVTELMDCNLSTYLSTPDHSSSLTSQCEISLSKDLASGLAYIHSRKIIHRDLCGVNVLLKRSQPFPVAKISDFGMSKLLDPLKFNTTISHRLGYLPPEALHEGDEDYDETLDVFSLGVIMMQIACRLENVKSAKERLSYLAEIKAGTHLLKLHIMACLQEKRPSAAVVCGQLEKHLLYRDAYRQDYDLVTIGGKRPILHSVHETTATAAQLSQECSDEALLQLSTEIAGYNDYKHRLGVSYAEIKNIDLTIDGIPGKFLAALKKWKSKNILQFNPSNSTATYGRLVEIASEIEDGGAVRSIHKACVEHTFQPHKTIVTATAAQLSQECSDEALLQLSTEIAGYDRYKHRLGLSHAEIGAIDKSPSMVDNIPGRFLAALKMWKSKSILEMYPLNSTATYDQLVEIATKIEDGEAVRSIHKACVEHT